MCTRTHFEKEAEIIRKWAIKLQQTNIYAWDWTPYPPLLDSASSYTCPYPPHEARWTELKPQEWVHRSPCFSEPPWYVTANSIFTPINFLCIKRGSLRKYIATEQKKYAQFYKMKAFVYVVGLWQEHKARSWPISYFRHYTLIKLSWRLDRPRQPRSWNTLTWAVRFPNTRSFKIDRVENGM